MIPKLLVLIKTLFVVLLVWVLRLGAAGMDSGGARVHETGLRKIAENASKDDLEECRYCTAASNCSSWWRVTDIHSRKGANAHYAAK